MRLSPALSLAAMAAATQFAAAAPQYTIVDLGLVGADTASQGNGVSPDGRFATGRSLGSGARAFSWTQAGGTVGLPNLASPARNFGVGNAVNNSGVVVGTGSTTAFGSSPLPLKWTNGVVAQMPLPPGETLGRLFAVNNAGVAVGSINGGSLERASIHDDISASIITTTTATGCYLRTAYGISDSGFVCGIGGDPNNAARNVGMYIDTVNGTAVDIGALPGLNSAIAFGLSNAGHVTGSTMLNQGSGLPFIWTQAGGMVAVPLPVGTSQGSGRGVNSLGWVVGNASSAFAIPFVYDGTQTYRIQDIIPSGNGWDLSTNTSSSALSISDTGVIVGTGVYRGAVHGYVAIPVACPADYNGDNQVDFFDYLDFAAAFDAEDPAADFNGDNQVDFFDYLDFAAAFDQGCD